MLAHTIGLNPEVIRVFAKCHNQRNIAEYEGYLEVDERLLTELLANTQLLLASVEKLSI